MLRPSSSVAGICTGFTAMDNQISIWNKYQSKYFNAFIPYQETLFPLQNYDFIRFGLVNPTNPTSSVDYSFSSYALFRILSSSIGDVNDVASSLTLERVITGSFSTDLQTSTPLQGFRIFRRIPDETFVVVDTYAQINVDPTVGGLLIPDDFNPAYDPITVARQAGIEL